MLNFQKKPESFSLRKTAKTKLLSPPKTIKLWNRNKRKVIAMFYVIC
jgi:hypothetical protein